MLHYVIYLLVGAVAGVLAGLLGIGGGLVIVPALTLLLPWVGVPQIHVVHIAVATSLATIIVTSSSSTWAHNKHGAVRWDIVKAFSPLLVVGIVLGGITATYIPGEILSKVIAVVIFIVALRMLLTKQKITPIANNHKQEPRWRFVLFTIFFGMLSAILGIGGGTFLVPYLQSKLHCTMRESIACGSASAVVLGSAATITYIIVGWNLPNMPAHTVGYIYWPAWLGIVIASIFCAPIGAKLAHKLPAQQLRYIFAGLLFIVVIKMLW